MRNLKEQFSDQEIKSAYLEITKVLASINLYLCGGFVPYLLLNEDSKRFHHDIEFIASLEEMNKIREILKKTKYYIPSQDSLNLLKNSDDYGLEVQVREISVGIYPYTIIENKIYQYSYNAGHQRFKIKIIEENLHNYLKEYLSYDGNDYKTISLEYLRKSKELASREKDLLDIKAIDKYGYDQTIYENIKIPHPINFQNKTLEEMKGCEL